MAKTRTFIALPVSDQVRKRAAHLIDRLSVTATKISWVAPDNLHLTLKFLGDQSDHELAGVCRAVQQVAQGTDPLEFRCHGAGAFPRPERPRTLWIGVDQGADALREFQQRLEDELAEQGLPRERRQYRPHLTVGRVRSGGAPMEELGQLVARQADFRVGQVEADEVFVMASQLRRGGSAYEVLSRARLGAPPTS